MADGPDGSLARAIAPIIEATRQMGGIFDECLRFREDWILEYTAIRKPSCNPVAMSEDLELVTQKMMSVPLGAMTKIVDWARNLPGMLNAAQKKCHEGPAFLCLTQQLLELSDYVLNKVQCCR